MSEKKPNTGSSENAREDAASASRIVCDGMLDISGVAVLHAQLLDALVAGQPITLDGSAVERADTAALQVLAAFFQDAGTLNITVQWSSASDVLIRSAGLLGVTEVLDLAALAA